MPLLNTLPATTQGKEEVEEVEEWGLRGNLTQVGEG